MRGRARLRSPPPSPLQLLLQLLLLLLFLLLGSARAAAAGAAPALPAPGKVEVRSHNLRGELRWAAVAAPGGPVRYTAQYRSASFEQWSGMGCAQTPRTQCWLPPELGRRWTLWFRVRAELGSLRSAWAQSAAFVPEANTTLGPPRVNRVSASSHSLLISVSPPFPPEHGDSLQYLVSYWENTTSPTRKQELSVVETLFQIGNLKESTVYCFSIQVQLKIISGHLLGEERAPECHRTALSEATRAGLIIALFILALIFVNLLAVALLLLWKHHQKIKFWAQPPLQIPAHFQEFLREPGLEELCSPAEEEPQAVVVTEGNGLEGEGSFTQHLQGQGSL